MSSSSSRLCPGPLAKAAACGAATYVQVFSSAENRILGYVVAGCIITFALFYLFFRHR